MFLCLPPCSSSVVAINVRSVQLVLASKGRGNEEVASVRACVVENLEWWKAVSGITR